MMGRSLPQASSLVTRPCVCVEGGGGGGGGGEGGVVTSHW